MNKKTEKKIQKAFKKKSWNEIKIADSWQIFKVMYEFVEGFEKMAKIGPCVSIFGSARTPADKEYYLLAEEIAYQLTQKGTVLLLVVDRELWRPEIKEHKEGTENR